ncbi:cathepsin O isoform X2 [Puntigrus tetrazona]|uniref:cathepsin O isoform X2 n=1 Tax=Puntigrus tetrazona TaxID=1606681 RepID=UPI001C89063E|nr:cathepsin O isoform X2 [Puntigrus tetrazona]
MAFASTLVVLIICHELLAGSDGVELIRKYLTDGERLKTFQREHENIEHHRSRINFQNSLKRQVFLNQALKKSNHSARYGINRFSDLSAQQFRERYLTARAETAPKFDPSSTGIEVKMNNPPRFDWRDRGIVAPVRNQESCGGCWAFSVVEAIETVSAKDGGRLQQLSVQQVIDCSYENKGCNGGSPVGALDWLKQTELKLVNEAEYPFKDMAGICQYFPRSHAGVAVRNYSVYDFSGQEEVMKSVLVESGPLVVIVDAISWQDYLGGIIQHHCSRHNPNHAVLITGYDTTGIADNVAAVFV